MDDRLHIHLHVYDEEMDVTVPRAEEEYYRNAAKLITERFNTYAKIYKGRKSDQTISRMVLIDIALQLEKQKANNDTKPYQDMIAQLTEEIEDKLGK